jgi:hypothetical protein
LTYEHYLEQYNQLIIFMVLLDLYFFDLQRYEISSTKKQPDKKKINRGPINANILQMALLVTYSRVTMLIEKIRISLFSKKKELI